MSLENFTRIHDQTENITSKENTILEQPYEKRFFLKQYPKYVLRVTVLSNNEASNVTVYLYRKTEFCIDAVKYLPLYF